MGCSSILGGFVMAYAKNQVVAIHLSVVHL